MPILRGPIGLVAVLAVAFVLTTMFFGFAIGSITGLVLMLSFFLLAKGFSKMADSVPWPRNRQTAKMAGIGLLAITMLMYGMFGLPSLGLTWEGLIGGTAQLTAPLGQAQVQTLATSCAAGISPELADEAASVTINAYDMVASAGAGTVVDLTSGCWFYENTNTGDGFMAVSTDTSAQTESSYWGIGDSV